MNNPMVKESNAQECIEINPRPSVVARNDQNQSNKRFNPNPKLCAPKGSKAQNAVYPDFKDSKENVTQKPTRTRSGNNSRRN